jgi:hypothetical protein
MPGAWNHLVGGHHPEIAIVTTLLLLIFLTIHVPMDPTFSWSCIFFFDKIQTLELHLFRGGGTKFQLSVL